MPLLICPNCNVGMTQVQRSGIELDICPQCRGVWLDRGELEKLLQPLREQATTPPHFLPPEALPQATPSPWSQGNSAWGHQPAPGHHDGHHDGHHGNHQTHQRGWRGLLDVFD